MRASAVLVVALAALLSAAACPGPVHVPPPPGPQPLVVDVSVAADAPVADPTDAPDVTGLLPDGVPDGVTVFDLGNLGITNGESGDIKIDVTSGLGAFAVLVYGQEASTVILARCVDPDGNLVVSDVDPTDDDQTQLAFARGFPAQVYSTNRVLGSLASGAFLVPNTPSVAPKSGVWKVRVGNYSVDVTTNPPRRQPSDHPVHVVVLVRGQDTGHGKIDLNLHFTGANGLTAATAPSDALVQGALGVVRDAYAAAKIDIGEVRMSDIDPAFADVTLAVGRCEAGDLDRVVEQGAGDEPGIGLFFIDAFHCEVGGGADVGSSIGGIAAGIPGPMFVHGTTHAGVAVATSFAAGDPQPLGVVMAHEMGHFLGLYHTRESGQGKDVVFDEIDDTPEDASAADNLMYFAAQDVTTLTDGQAQVLRSNPFVVPVE